MKIRPICECVRDNETYIFAVGYQLRVSHLGNAFLKYEDVRNKKFVHIKKSRETIKVPAIKICYKNKAEIMKF